MQIKTLIALFTGIHFLFPSDCNPPKDYYSKVIQDGVCTAEEYTPECTDYLLQMIPFDDTWEVATSTEKNIIAKAYYSALFAPMANVETMIDGTYVPTTHRYVLGMDGPQKNTNTNQVVFNRLMNTITCLSYDPNNDTHEMARYEFFANKFVINRYFYTALLSYQWYLHLPVLMHETTHKKEQWMHVVCPAGYKANWCDMGRTGAYGLEAVVLTSIYRGNADPSSHFFLDSDTKQEIFDMFESRFTHIEE